jgi:hypothetical protein
VRNRSPWVKFKVLGMWQCHLQVDAAIWKDYGAFIFRVKQSKMNFEYEGILIHYYTWKCAPNDPASHPRRLQF